MKPSWFRRYFHRHTRRAVLAGALTLFAAGSVWAQPLTPGMEVGDHRVLLEQGSIRYLDQQQSLRTLDLRKSELEQPSSLLTPKNPWEDKLLILGSNGYALLSGPNLEAGRVVQGEFESPLVLAEQVVLKDEKGTLHIIGPGDSAHMIEELEIASGPHRVNDESFLLILKDGTTRLFTSGSWQSPTEDKLPFPAEQANVTSSGDRLLVWSHQSKEGRMYGGGRFPVLQFPPVKGVQALGGGQFVLGQPSSLCYINEYSVARVLPSPAYLTKDTFQDARFLTDRHTLHVLFVNQRERLVNMAMKSDGKASGGVLGQNETIKDLVLPEPNSSDRPFLLTESKMEENKVDEDGKPVIDPQTGEPEKETVRGHVLYSLNSAGVWRALENKPRERLLGPAGLIGKRLIYATQTEPPNMVGVKREFDARYPYPKVILHAFDSTQGTPAWITDLPRGESPSAPRIPVESWPTLGNDGPFLMIDEKKRLMALDPVSGEVEWRSQALPMDESRPAMLRWPNSLGLVATKSTTKQLIVLDDHGNILKTETLNAFFNDERTWNLVGVLVICLALIIYIYLAGKKKLFIRRIAGLEALDEAVGRATEMGKPVLYVTGLADVDDIQTLAALSILSHVAKKTAEYDASILTTTSRAVTFSAAQEVVKDAYIITGRPDSFSLESVRYISDDQFGYAAGVDGLMVREKPAANFYMGKFYAESLIFAETGHATGAIQIAGTAQANQLPFFVAACDYTLIGEELFAASAYLSGDPLQVGSLRGQDVGKAIVMVVLFLLSLFVTFGGEVSL